MSITKRIICFIYVFWKAKSLFIFHCSGYVSPEYVMYAWYFLHKIWCIQPCTLLEILSGRKSHSNYHYEHPVNLAGYVSFPNSKSISLKHQFLTNVLYNGSIFFQAWKLWEEGKALELVDQALDGSYPNSIVIRCIHIALLCVQENPMDV